MGPDIAQGKMGRQTWKYNHTIIHCDNTVIQPAVKTDEGVANLYSFPPPTAFDELRTRSWKLVDDLVGWFLSLRKRNVLNSFLFVVSKVKRLLVHGAKASQPTLY